ncbi:lectin-like [Panicum virgatum]|uniref:lectin-like n=1 Tax=Panicum virgatum TaxID=38727 RepID=UPI0019D519B6|nr:lectin-like [Panicum virgatum]
MGDYAALAALAVAVACALMASAATPARAQQCGQHAGGMLCPNNLCCSRSGRCGLGADYCGAGLGVEFCGDGCHSGACCEQRCGWQAGGDACTNGYCCGRNGYCGLGGDYCGTGCQSGQCLHAGGGAAARAVGELLNRTASAAGTKASLPQ